MLDWSPLVGGFLVDQCLTADGSSFTGESVCLQDLSVGSNCCSSRKGSSLSVRLWCMFFKIIFESCSSLYNCTECKFVYLVRFVI